MIDKENLEREWYGTLPDAERAEVLKALITERGAVQRAEIEANGKIKEAQLESDGFHWTRAAFIAAIIIGLMITGNVTCHAIDAFAPPVAPSRAAASASASTTTGTSDAR